MCVGRAMLVVGASTGDTGRVVLQGFVMQGKESGSQSPVMGTIGGVTQEG